MSTNHFGITPVVKSGKLQWIDLQAPAVAGLTIRMDRQLIEELQHYLTLLLDAEKNGTIEELTQQKG